MRPIEAWRPGTSQEHEKKGASCPPIRAREDATGSSRVFPASGR